MFGDDHEAIVSECSPVSVMFGTAPRAEIIFGAVLKETTSLFQGDVMNGIDTAEVGEFGRGNAEGVGDGRGVSELVSRVWGKWKCWLGLCLRVVKLVCVVYVGTLTEIGRDMYRWCAGLARTVWWGQVWWRTGGGGMGRGILIGYVEGRVWLGEEGLELGVSKGDCC